MVGSKLALLLASSISVCCVLPDAANTAHAGANSLLAPALLSQSNNDAASLFSAAEEIYQTGAYADSLSRWELALASYRSVGDVNGEAATLNRIGHTYAGLGDNAKALDYFQQGLAIARSINNRQQAASALNGIGATHAVEGRYADAVSVLKEALDISRLADDRKAEADSLNHLGLAEITQANFPAALDYFLESLTISKQIDYVSGEARSLANHGYVYNQQQDYQKALTYYQQALAIREQTGDQTAIFNANQAIGGIYQSLERYDEAIKTYGRGREIARALRDDQKDLQSLDFMGYASEVARRYEDAITYYVQGLNKAKRIENRSQAAKFSLSIGVVQSTLGSYEAAIESYSPSLAFYRESGDRKNEAIALRNIGLAQASLKDYQTALSYYQQSLEIEKALENSSDQARILEDIGSAYSALEQHSKATDSYRQSLTIRQTLSDTAREERLSRKLGFAYNEIEDYANATKYYQNSLELSRSLGDVLNEAHTLLLLGISYGERGEYAQALAFYQQSAALKDLEGKKILIDFVDKTLDSADEAHKEQPIPGLIEVYESALALYRDAGLEALVTLDNSDSYEKYSEDSDLREKFEKRVNNLFKLYWDAEQFEQALPYLKQISDLREQKTANALYTFGQNATLNAFSLEAFVNLDTAVNLELVNASISALLEALPDSAAAADLSLLNIFRRKGRSLEALAIQSQSLFAEASQERAQILKEVRELNSLIADLRLETVLDDSTADANRREEQAIESAITDLIKQLYDLDDSSAQVAEIDTIEVTSTDAIRQLIPSQAALIEFVSYQPSEAPINVSHYAAYVVGRTGKIQAVDLGETTAINQKAAAYRQALRTQSSRADSLARELDEMIIAPIRPFIGDSKQLLISPDGQLNVIPFDALVDTAGQYLIENYQISYLTSGRDLLKMQRSPSNTGSSVVIANPDYASVAPSSTDAESTLTISNQRAAGVEQMMFSPLPGTATEASAIAPLLPNPTVFTQRQATENQMKRLSAPSILHIATHGFFLSDVASASGQTGDRGASFDLTDTEEDAALLPSTFEIENPLLRSGLALAGVNARSSGGDRTIEDGILTALEVSNLNLRGTQLVVLSACETGLGATSDGDGVYGLRRAFTIAGAESQLMSLWQVDDTSTSELMQIYYENLMNKNQGRSEALRSAQLELLNTGTYAHPYYWSSFIFSGDWRPLE